MRGLHRREGHGKRRPTLCKDLKVPPHLRGLRWAQGSFLTAPSEGSAVDAGSWRAGRGDHCLQGSRLVELVGLCAVSAAAHRLPQGPPRFLSIWAQPGVYEAQTLGRAPRGAGG